MTTPVDVYLHGTSQTQVRSGNGTLLGGGGGGGGANPYLSHELFITKAELDTQPMSGTYWTQLTSVAGRTTAATDFNSTNGDFHQEVFSQALVYARMKGAVADATADPYRVSVGNRLQSWIDLTLGTGGTTLTAHARQLGLLVLAADLVNLADYSATLDTDFRTKVDTVITRVDNTATDGFVSLPNGALRRPNNHGCVCRFSLTCAYLYLGGHTTDLNAHVVVPLRRYLGDTSFHNGSNIGVDAFNWNAEQSWNSGTSTATYIGVNSLGATKDGNNFDGIQADDQRRGTPAAYSAGSFPNNYASVEYTHDAAEAVAFTVLLLEKNNHAGAKNWSNSAAKRAIEWLYWANDNHSALGYGKIGEGKRGSQLGPICNYMYGTALTIYGPFNSDYALGLATAFEHFLFNGRSI